MLKFRAGIAVKRRNMLGCFLVLISCLSCAVGQQYEIFADVLKHNSIPFPPTSIPNLTEQITSYATLNDDREFVIAYYLASPKDQALRYPLFVTRFNKISGQWQQVALSDIPVKTHVGSTECLGSVLDVKRNGTWYYLTLHWNPSAGCLLILKNDLTVDSTLTGGVAAFLKAGEFIYWGNMVHFADVHPETLWLYNQETRESKQLYPQAKDPFRDGFSAKLQKVINPDRCRANNWACDPNRFSSYPAYPVMVSEQTASLAFRVTFDPEGFLDRYEAEDSGLFDDDDYVYVFQIHPFRWREFSIYDLKPKFGTDSLEELLTPAMLKRVFATPAPN